MSCVKRSIPPPLNVSARCEVRGARCEVRGARETATPSFEAVSKKTCSSKVGCGPFLCATVVHAIVANVVAKMGKAVSYRTVSYARYVRVQSGNQ